MPVKDKRGKTVNYIGVFTDITSKKESDEKIKHYAFYDPLTNLANRRFFVERLDQSIKISKRKNEWLAVVFIDLDYFKEINDTYGHLVGDQLLCKVAEVLKENIRETDMASRFGGDEFVLLLQNVASKENVITLTRHILECLNQASFHVGGEVLPIKPASLGGALYPEDAQVAEKLIQLADEAMYQVKSTTRNAIKFK